MLSVVCSASDGNIFDGLYMSPHTLLLLPPASSPPSSSPPSSPSCPPPLLLLLLLQVSQILIRLMDALSTPSEMVQKIVSSTIIGLMKGVKARGEEGAIVDQLKSIPIAQPDKG